MLLAAQNERCGTMKVLNDYLDKNPATKADYEATKARWDAEDVANLNNRAFTDTIFIPVVFHIIHNGDAYGTGENITDEACYTQIDALNKSYNLQNVNVPNIPTEFKGVAARTRIMFCLAQKDPNGNYTTGITRHDLGQATWDDETSIDGTLKPATVWNRDKYLNIWTARFGGDIATRGVLAYAQFPGWGNANSDGVIARFNVVGTVGNLLSGYQTGNTIVHEVGHWLGLFHIWGDDNGACTGSDNINDTPNQADQYFGCPTYPQVSCGSSDMFMNFMDYTNDDCMSMFTIGQSNRMRQILGSTRSSIKSSLGNCYYNIDAVLTSIISPNDTMCTNKIQPTIVVKNNGLTEIANFNVDYSIDGVAQTPYSWTGYLPLFSEVTLFLPAQSSLSNGAHTFSATVNQINGNSTDNVMANNTRTTNFYINSSSQIVYRLPFTEDFEFGGISSDWTIYNPNNDNTWNIATASAYTIGTYSYFINNKNYSTFPNGKKDAMITPPLDFTGKSNVKLSWDLSYAKRGNRYDSLLVAYSLDCGKTWKKLWYNGGVTMATSSNEGLTVYVPSSDTEWVHKDVDLSFLQNQPNVLIKFENISYWGHALYLDNINVNGNNVGINDVKVSSKIEMYPNPANDYTLVRLENQQMFDHIEIYNMMGQKIKEIPVLQDVIRLNTADFTTGNYILKFSGKNGYQTEKLMVN